MELGSHGEIGNKYRLVLVGVVIMIRFFNELLLLIAWYASRYIVGVLDY